MMRKDDGQKPGALSRSLTLLVNAGRSRTAVVSVGDVKKRNASKGAFDGGDFGGLTDIPGSMAHPIFGHEIDLRFAGDSFLHEVFQFTVRAINQKHWAGLGTQGLDVRSAIILLVG